MIFLELFYTFFIIGLFGFGGGYGMISLIQHEVVVEHHWMTSAEFTNIIAISQMTPGPVGINTATYSGYTAAQHAYESMAMGVCGSVIATFALVLPSFILMIMISKMFLKHMKSPMVQNVFSGLRPAVVGLLLAATLLLVNEENFGSPTEDKTQFFVSIALFAATFIGVKVFKVNPIRMIIFAAIVGVAVL